MKEIQDQGLLQTYLQKHQLELILIEPLRAHLSLYSFAQGETICFKGDPSESLYVLVKGKLKIYTTTAEGKTLIISFKTPLELIGDVEYIQGTELLNTVEAVSPVHMICIPYRWLRKYGQNHPPLLQFLLEIITQKFYRKSDFLSLNLMHPVEVRLASYLLSITYDESDPQFTGQLSTINLVDTANFISTSYRHLNRVIQKFCQQGLTERSKGYILVKDREGLSRLAHRNIYE
ncbi:Crp/Fnr family transcriptional regulator [Paenibacillus sp. FSL H7-0357]|uniref:Crp/Fnr family transcriptional regulator n=1 Tax=Paenibacillus sp. FSL H7-0357 TaxID=1536774 RepID=UPI0004F6DF91|nr:cyclic nucleotide-binding domain-containing protein [Paenibacillus sp. FSL H7-0357]AIQ18215.1 Crp/Fnr family transcriptional regulator [Paenibacillus sp. FSL H7-0357]